MYRDSYFDKFNIGKGNAKTEFSRRLRQLRKEKGVSQEYMSEKLGLAKCTYGTYENSKYIPDADTIAHLSDYFNVSADFLLGLTDSSYTERNENLYSVNFSSSCKDKLLDIAKDKVLTEIFEMLITNRHFEDFLMYMHTYLVFSAKVHKDFIERIGNSYNKATKIDVSLNDYISVDAYPNDRGIKISDVYNSMITDILKDILKEISQECSSYFEMKLIRILQMEEAKNRES